MAIALRTEDLTRKFGSFTAVDHVSLTIDEGSIFGFLGPNGAGKTTLIRMLCGLLEPTSGNAIVLGYDAVTQSEEIKQSIGYMSQMFSLYTDLSVMENLRFYARIYGVPRRERNERIEEVIGIVGIDPYRKRLAKALSGGWKQRLALACSLVHRPRLMFLDEPTAGIDPVARRELWDLLFDLSGRGVTFFVTTHYMDEAERCTHVGYIQAGQLIVKGTPKELKKLPDVTPEGYERYDVRCDPLPGALRFLSDQSYVLDATIFADSLHVLIEHGAEGRMREDLRREGFGDATTLPIPPTLEDVFVTLTRQRAAQELQRAAQQPVPA